MRSAWPNWRASRPTCTAMCTSRTTCCSRRRSRSSRHPDCESRNTTGKVTDFRQSLFRVEATMTVDALVAPQQVISLARAGRLPKPALASMLTTRARRLFNDACGEIEMQYTEACRAKGEPCLESGCSAAGERCLQPIVAAGAEYDMTCG